MKKIIVVLLLVPILLTGCAMPSADEDTIAESQSVLKRDDADMVRSVWIAYYELQKLIDPDDKSAFEKTVASKFKRIKRMGFNTVTVQVRPCADAFYISDYYPSSKYCFGTQGCYMPYDPLSIMCDVAGDVGIGIEAWINPYRVSQRGSVDGLCDTNVAKKWYESSDKATNVYVMKNGVYFNPASHDVIDLIANGAAELAERYDISAVHMDDYFYPTMSKKIDAAEYAQYRNSGGSASLPDWRRKNVDRMVKAVYSAVKKANSSVRVGISPAANIDTDYNELYADVAKWCTKDGYLDYICPQVYYGFYNDAMPFMSTVKKWCRVSKKPVYIGLPLYKSGKEDKYASPDNDRAIKEFVVRSNVISRQIRYLSKLDDVKGIYVFSYSQLFDKQYRDEVNNMIESLSD